MRYSMLIALPAVAALMTLGPGCGGDPPAASTDTDTDTDSDSDADSDSDSDADSDSDSDTDSDSDSDADAEFDCVPSEQSAETACEPATECCDFPDPMDDYEAEWFEDWCWAEWVVDDSFYGVECEGVGTEEALCWCFQYEDMFCEPTTEDSDLACTPEEQCCGFPDAEGEAEIEAYGQECYGEWFNGDSAYYVGCEEIGSPDAFCYCWQEESAVCEPTEQDPELACLPADQCCGFPEDADAEYADDWGDGCEAEWWDDTITYYVTCEGLGTEGAYCFCEEWEEEEDW